MTTDPLPAPLPEPPPATIEPDGQARRLHPLSLGFEIAHLVKANLFPTLFAGFSAASGGVIGALIGAAIFGGALLVAIFRYFTFRYTISESKLLVDQGLIFRQHRSVPIERIQNIDSVQNLFHRWLGVAEVRIETASGSEPEAIMRVITVAEVEQLRQNLSSQKMRAIDQPAQFVAADGNDIASPLPPAAIPIETVLVIPTKRLFQAGLISNRGLVLASLALGYMWQMGFRDGRWDEPTKVEVRSWLQSWLGRVFNPNQAINLYASSNGLVMVVVALVALVGIVMAFRLFSAAWYILKFHGYRLQLRGDDLVIQCGLLTKVSATVPRNRIQVISVQRTWLARKCGLAAVRIETLGGSGKEEEDASTTVARRWFIPILTEAELPQVLKVIDPQIEWASVDTPWQPLSKMAFKRMIRLPLAACALTLITGIVVAVWFQAVVGIGLITLSVIVAVCATLLIYRRARSRRYARTSAGFIYRSGTLTQKTSFGFWDRLQDVDLVQSPIDRRWQMASLRFDTAGAGTADHELLVRYLDASVAEREYRSAIRNSGQATSAHVCAGA